MRNVIGVRKTTNSRTRVSRSSATRSRSAISYSDPLVLDNFVGANSTAIDSHTPDTVYSGGWSQTAATSFYIQDNTIQPNRYTDGDKAVIETGTNNHTVEATVIPYNLTAKRGDPGIVFRYIDANNYWYCYPETDGPIISMKSVVGGTVTEHMIMKYYNMASGEPLTMRVDCINQNIVLWLNGVEIVTVTSSLNMNGTKVGIYVRVSNGPAGKPSWTSFRATQFRGTYVNWPIYNDITEVTPIVTPGSAGTWESDELNDPSIAWDSANSRWVMAYTGDDGDSVQDLGIAYATNLAGPWTKEAANPVLTSAASDINGMNGGLVKFKGTWYYYYGTNSGTIISCATSTNLTTWTKRGIVFRGDSSTNFDGDIVFDAFARVTESGNTLQLWYVGKQGGLTRGISYATSTDGLNFVRYSDQPVLNIPEFSRGNFGEPTVYVPTGQEGKQMLITFDGAKYNAVTARFFVQALTLDGGQTWRYRTNVLTGSGSGWKSVQVYDPDLVVDSNNVMYLFYTGAAIAGTTLGLGGQIGVAKTDYPYLALAR